MSDSRITAIVDTWTKAEEKDGFLMFASTAYQKGRESSMIPAVHQPKFNRRYHQEIEPRYLEALMKGARTEEEGINNTLNEVLEYVRSKHKAALAEYKIALGKLKKADRDKFGPKFNGLKKETPEIRHVSALQENVWKFEVVIRGFTDPAQTITWANLLSDSKSCHISGGERIPLRRLAAFHWKAASDPKLGLDKKEGGLSFSARARDVEDDLRLQFLASRPDKAKALEEFNSPEEKEKRRQYCRELSMNEYVETCFNTFRGHNEGQHAHNYDVNNPRCPDGTYGDQMLYAGSFNSMAAVEAPSYFNVPTVIADFILEKIAELAAQQKSSYIRAVWKNMRIKLDMGDDDDELNPAELGKVDFVFKHYLANPGLKEKLFALIVKKFPDKLPPTIREDMDNIFNYTLQQLRCDLPPGVLIDANISSKFDALGNTSDSENPILQNLVGNPNIFQFRVAIGAINHEFKQFKRIADAEMVRCFLDEKHSLDIDKLQGLLQQLQFIKRLQGINKEIESEIVNIAQEKKLGDDGLLEAINISQEQATQLEKSISEFETHLNSLKTIPSEPQTLKKFNAHVQNEILAKYKKKPGRTDWSAAFLRVAFAYTKDKAAMNIEMISLLQLFSKACLKDYQLLKNTIKDLDLAFDEYQAPNTPDFPKIKSDALRFLNTQFQSAFPNSDCPRICGYHETITEQEILSQLSSVFEQELKIELEEKEKKGAQLSVYARAEVPKKALSLLQDQKLEAKYSLPLCIVDWDEKKQQSLPNSNYLKNMKDWQNAARHLVGDDSGKLFTQHADKKLKLFVILTFLKQLGLSEIRREDYVALENLLNRYFDGYIIGYSKPGETVTQRLAHVGAFLSQIITLLKPVIKLYKNGNVRLNMEEAQKLCQIKYKYKIWSAADPGAKISETFVILSSYYADPKFWKLDLIDLISSIGCIGTNLCTTNPQVSSTHPTLRLATIANIMSAVDRADKRLVGGLVSADDVLRDAQRRAEPQDGKTDRLDHKKSPFEKDPEKIDFQSSEAMMRLALLSTQTESKDPAAEDNIEKKSAMEDGMDKKYGPDSRTKDDSPQGGASSPARLFSTSAKIPNDLPLNGLYLNLIEDCRRNLLNIKAEMKKAKPPIEKAQKDAFDEMYYFVGTAIHTLEEFKIGNQTTQSYFNLFNAICNPDETHIWNKLSTKPRWQGIDFSKFIEMKTQMQIELSRMKSKIPDDPAAVKAIIK